MYSLTINNSNIHYQCEDQFNPDANIFDHDTVDEVDSAIDRFNARRAGRSMDPSTPEEFASVIIFRPR